MLSRNICVISLLALALAGMLSITAATAGRSAGCRSRAASSPM